MPSKRWPTQAEAAARLVGHGRLRDLVADPAARAVAGRTQRLRPLRRTHDRLQNLLGIH